MSYKIKDVIYETEHYFVLKVAKGVEVYEKGITHSTRCAQIYLSNGSEDRGVLECDKRELERKD